ncbi:rRNA maturation RNase YbeY [Salinispirillum sp. LH 10-3-1]|uniref:Endoribonuclease YbeY n=1 Tax=Salinispirillum sp. LH 10-3-1 TaxID=2952525 RepID=A0AB38YI59_9GAMM
MSTLEVTLQDACTAPGERPDEAMVVNWLAPLATRLDSASGLTVRLVDSAESQQLNNTYRGKDKPTNVLSFPFEAPADIPLDEDYLGDLVICVPVVNQEAEEQQKPILHHWAHMVIHGALHLLGYDHISDDDAEEMEQLERELLFQLGIPDPYIINGSENLTP